MGSVSADKEVYTKFLASKAKTDEEKKNAEADKENLPGEINKETVFYRDAESGNLILKGYQVKGFLKEAAKALRGTFEEMGSGTTSQGKIDNLIFIEQMDIPLLRDGEVIPQPDGHLERPLRAMTMQGPRVSIARSEMVKAGWTCEFSIRLISDVKGGRAKTYTWETVERMMEYGALKGLLQWRNAGYGSFTTEWLDERP